MIYTHNIDPVLLRLGPVSIRWYGLAYALGFLIGYAWLKFLVKNKKISLSNAQVETLIFAVMLGVVAGARIGYFILYRFAEIFTNPLEIFAVWNGGMSLHGGVIGVALAVIYCSRKFKKSFLEISDLLVIPGAIALTFGRIANFINGELWGRPTGGDWGVIFPRADTVLRHPSQLYASAQNLLIAIILVVTFQRKAKTGVLSFLFLILYGVSRILSELLWREPLDGFILGLPRGAAYSAVMIVIGLAGIVWISRRKK